MGCVKGKESVFVVGGRPRRWIRTERFYVFTLIMVRLDDVNLSKLFVTVNKGIVILLRLKDALGKSVRENIC